MRPKAPSFSASATADGIRPEDSGAAFHALHNAWNVVAYALMLSTLKGLCDYLGTTW